MEERIVASGPRELDSLMRALGGGFVPAGSGGEPIRNPDSYPTGKNFYGIDPDKVPKPASWEMGVKLAEQMLADHVKKHGTLSGEGLVRHLGRRDDAARRRARIADLLSARHEAGLERPRQGGRRRGDSHRRS